MIDEVSDIRNTAAVATGIMTSCPPPDPPLLSERRKEDVDDDDDGQAQSAVVRLLRGVRGRFRGGDTWSGASAASCLSGLLWPVYN